MLLQRVALVPGGQIVQIVALFRRDYLWKEACDDTLRQPFFVRECRKFVGVASAVRVQGFHHQLALRLRIDHAIQQSRL